MIPLFLLSWLGKKWIKLVLIGLALAVLVWFGTWCRGIYEDAKAYRVMKPAYDALVEAQTKANKKVIAIAPMDEAARIELVATKAALQLQAIETSLAWGRVHALQETINAETGCPVVRLSDDWGVFFSIATTGNAADPAPSETDRSDGAVPPG